jgi:uridine phosphorylase
MSGKSSELILDAEGRPYHIGAGPGELSRYILLVGDPDRAGRAADMLSSVRVRRRNREFVTVTGASEEREVTVMSTGIGCDNMEIAVVEICQVVPDPVIIRVGSSGALQKDIDTGTLVISTAAVRLESTSLHFVPEGYPAAADHRVVRALERAAAGVPHRTGITASGSGFYGAQGRDVPGFPPRRPGLLDDLARLNVLNFEMEASTLFTLASVRGFPAGCVCAVFANRPRGEFIAEGEKPGAEERALTVGLGALHLLSRPEPEKP